MPCLCSLKADNILLDTHLTGSDAQWLGTANVADLGITQMVDLDTGLIPHYFSGGTMPFMAPELFEGTCISPAVDTYAFGMVMWELFHMDTPYDGMPGPAMQSGGMLPRCSSAMEPGYRAIMAACWDATPAMRPSMALLEQALELLL